MLVYVQLKAEVQHMYSTTTHAIEVGPVSL